MPRRADVPCRRCGMLMWRGKGALPPGQAMCQPCRRIEPQRTTGIKTPCLLCSEPSWGARCRRCYNKAQRIRPDDDTRVTRRLREQAVPGLGQMARRRLLARWVRQHRACTYCASPASTIDHVIPLIRGGTNYEGNLVPACKRCNSSKAARLLVEWPKWGAGVAA